MIEKHVFVVIFNLSKIESVCFCFDYVAKLPTNRPQSALILSLEESKAKQEKVNVISHARKGTQYRG